MKGIYGGHTMSAPSDQAKLLQIVYYDGQFDDSRLCVALACTAALAGAAVTNHTEALKLLKVQPIPLTLFSYV